jgi:hypothetical protein
MVCTFHNLKPEKYQFKLNNYRPLTFEDFEHIHNVTVNSTSCQLKVAIFSQKLVGKVHPFKGRSLASKKCGIQQGSGIIDKCIVAVGDIQPPVQWVWGGGSFLGMKQVGHEADHLLPTSAKVKKAWICTFTSQYVFVA